ncbi:hypothetical protein [Luteimonas sp. R10]|uniref:hypothetical protein n=1 Tax=Luteimonas sp. R10 TaxID=3108176 RepID=UPI003093805D|nr:hypothetical protein U3649_14600 [Luteimonas sp. R10]
MQVLTDPFSRLREKVPEEPAPERFSRGADEGAFDQLAKSALTPTLSRKREKEAFSGMLLASDWLAHA